MAKIKVKGTEISIITVNNDDYISLTDMLKAKDGEFFISDWVTIQLPIQPQPQQINRMP